MIELHEGTQYRVRDDYGDERVGTYTGREQGAGVEFHVFATRDRLPGQPGYVEVYIPTSEHEAILGVER
jgi:hypothetical protein